VVPARPTHPPDFPPHEVRHREVADPYVFRHLLMALLQPYPQGHDRDWERSAGGRWAQRVANPSRCKREHLVLYQTCPLACALDLTASGSWECQEARASSGRRGGTTVA
jgi:hypothetical protein